MRPLIACGVLMSCVFRSGLCCYSFATPLAGSRCSLDENLILAIGASRALVSPGIPPSSPALANTLKTTSNSNREVDCLLVLVQASSYTVFCRSETPIFTVEVISCCGGAFEDDPYGIRPYLMF